MARTRLSGRNCIFIAGETFLSERAGDTALDLGTFKGKLAGSSLHLNMSVIGGLMKSLTSSGYLAMNAATERLKPLLAAGGKKSAGKICLGTVRGDMHDIGKNLVKIMMEGAGLEVVDLGVDVSAEQFVDTAVNEGCALIGCSAMLTTTMDEMRRVVELASERGIRGKVKIMVGGAPITQEFCYAVGADCYTEDAAQAAQAAVRLLDGE